jgi:uncharacterized protein (TIGR02996 family)
LFRRRPAVDWGQEEGHREGRALDTQLASLLQGCKEEPGDVARRLVLADWLDDHGEPGRALLVRRQCGQTLSRDAAWCEGLTVTGKQREEVARLLEILAAVPFASLDLTSNGIGDGGAAALAGVRAAGRGACGEGGL